MGHDPKDVHFGPEHSLRHALVIGICILLMVKMLVPISLPQEISINNLNLIRKYIQSETVIPMNIYETTTKVFDFVLDGPFSGTPNCPLVAFDSSKGTAFDSLRS